jgi:hypothetical protein
MKQINAATTSISGHNGKVLKHDWIMIASSRTQGCNHVQDVFLNQHNRNWDCPRSINRLVAFGYAAPSDQRVIDQPNRDDGDLQFSPRRGAVGRYLTCSGYPPSNLAPAVPGFPLSGKVRGLIADYQAVSRVGSARGLLAHCLAVGSCIGSSLSQNTHFNSVPPLSLGVGTRCLPQFGQRDTRSMVGTPF